MKKIVAIIMALAMGIVIFVGCNNSTQKNFEFGNMTKERLNIAGLDWGSSIKDVKDFYKLDNTAKEGNKTFKGDEVDQQQITLLTSEMYFPEFDKKGKVSFCFAKRLEKMGPGLSALIKEGNNEALSSIQCSFIFETRDEVKAFEDKFINLKDKLPIGYEKDRGYTSVTSNKYKVNGTTFVDRCMFIIADYSDAYIRSNCTDGYRTLRSATSEEEAINFRKTIGGNYYVEITLDCKTTKSLYLQ